MSIRYIERLSNQSTEQHGKHYYGRTRSRDAGDLSEALSHPSGSVFSTADRHMVRTAVADELLPDSSSFSVTVLSLARVPTSKTVGRRGFEQPELRSLRSLVP